MTSYDQQPGELNLSMRRGDDFSALIDFSITMPNHSVSAVLTSLVTGAEILQFTTTFASAVDGKVNISLTDAQTSALARGTYGWAMRWIEGNATRTALTGFVEVT